MKNILLLIVVFVFASCKKDDEGCNCTGKFTTPEHIGDGTYFYVPKTPIDCETGNYTGGGDIQPNAIFVNCND